MKTLFASMLAAAALVAGAPAHAQAPAAKPGTIVVPFPPGGSTDQLARAIAPKLAERTAQQWVVDNKPGATGAIGAAQVKRAPADGNTLLVASIAVWAVNPHMQKNLAYDPSRDFDLLTVAVRAPNVLVAAPGFAANSVAELVAAMKRNPDKVTFANSGTGSSDHLTAALFWQRAGVDGVHVPYKGGAPAITDLMGGQIDVSFQNINAVLQHVKAGKLKALAITGDKRSPLLPNVPTLAEAGIRDADVYSWQAIAAPRGLPAEVKAKLHSALVAAINDPSVKPKMLDQGFEIVANTPEEFARFQQQELARWKAVIETGQITVD